jgi:fumarylacetoacetate (FAA) hydrolase
MTGGRIKDSSSVKITQFCDGSAYLIHAERVRKSRGEELPEQLRTDPLMYQGVSDKFLEYNEPIYPFKESYGLDFEAEVGVILDDTPMGVSVSEATEYIKYVTIINDISLRRLIPAELAKGFGFLQGKPHSSLGLKCIPLRFLNGTWKEHDAVLDADLVIDYNGKEFGRINTANMDFNFAQLISHAAKTRPLSSGTLIGSGTVSSHDLSDGYGCLLERNVVEGVDEFMNPGDTIKMYIVGYEDTLIIDQQVAF